MIYILNHIKNVNYPLLFSVDVIGHNINPDWLYLSGNDCVTSAGTWFPMLYVNCDISFCRTNTMLCMPMTLETHPSHGMFSGEKVLRIYPLSSISVWTVRELQYKLFKSLQPWCLTLFMIRSTLGMIKTLLYRYLAGNLKQCSLFWYQGTVHDIDT